MVTGGSSNGGSNGGNTSGGSSSTGAFSSSGSGGNNNYTGTDCIEGGTQCSDCIDNDGDGLLDAFDPECTGPADNDEGTFATGIPGDNIDFCQDCFFDGNSGHEDDGCQYNTECLYGNEPAGPDSSACFNCDVSETCVDNCGKYTPNGCDCFGCCEVYDEEGNPHLVLLESSCTVDKLGDSDACQSCVQSDQCVNDCDECEICIGKTELPDSCSSTDPDPDCDPETESCTTEPEPSCGEGQQSCSQNKPCAGGYYCLTGCCVEVVLK